MDFSKLFYYLFSCLLVAQISAQSKLEQIDELVDYCAENGMFNGNILIAEHGEIIYHESVGLADFRDQRNLELNHPFCLGSISKQFTAFGIMVLVHQDKLEYTSTIGSLLPELPQYMHAITIRHLLQHTSGLKRTHYGDKVNLKNDEVFENIINATGDQLLFEPGSDISYSNSAYILLAIIIEKVSGQHFEAFLKEQVWQPLGMTNTFVVTEEDIDRSNWVIGFNGYGELSDFNVLTYGTNGIYSTTEDLFRWAQSMSTDLIMPYPSKVDSYTPAMNDQGEKIDFNITGNVWGYYGMGQYIYKDGLDGVIGHTGAFGGFYNLLMRDMNRDWDIIALTNNGRRLPLVQFGQAIHQILNDQPYSLPQISIEWTLRNQYYNDIDAAIELYHSLKSSTPDKYKFDNQWELNRLGYALMSEDRLDDAIKILKLLVQEFPDIANPYDSLGEAYLSDNQLELALECYERAVAIEPNYFNADAAKAVIQEIKEKLNE